MRMWYVLDENNNPVPCSDLEQIEKFLGNIKKRSLKKTQCGDVEVSTVFLSLNHNYSGYGEPVLWETMIFGGEHDGYQRRYTSKADALLGHEEAVALCSPVETPLRKFRFEQGE